MTPTDTWRPVPGGDTQIRDDGQHIHVRQTRRPSVQLRFDYGEWDALIAGVRAGEFDPPTINEKD